MSKKELAKKQETQVAIPGEGQAWGGEDLAAGDMLVPKLLLMQGLSEAVTNGDAKQGEILDSITNEVVGGITNVKTAECKAIDLVAFSSFKTWIQEEKRGEKFEYVTQFPVTPDNVAMEREAVVNGVETRFNLCLNFYVLRPDQIAKGEAFPYVVSFRRTSMRAGKKLATIAQKLKAMGNKPLAFRHFQLLVVPMENEKGKFWGFDVKEGQNSTAEELQVAFDWYNAFKTTTVKIHEVEEPEAPVAASGEADRNPDY